MSRQLSRQFSRPLHLDPDDAAPEERGARMDEAMRRFTIRQITAPDTEFNAAYDVLHEEFGARGEIEERSLLAHEMLHAPDESNGSISYELLTFYDGDTLAGVRDVFTCVLPDRSGVLVLLSHSLILPPWRRSGLGGLIRAAPVRIARQQGMAADIPGGGRVVLMAEMDPIDPVVEATVVRYLAYCRSGFFVIPSEEILYFQPDFSDWKREGRSRHGLPMTMVLRVVEAAGGSAVDPVTDPAIGGSDTLPAALMRQIYTAVNAIHERHYPECVAERRAITGERLEADRPYQTIRVRRDRLREAAPLLRAEMLPRFMAQTDPPQPDTPPPNTDTPRKDLDRLLSDWNPLPSPPSHLP